MGLVWRALAGPLGLLAFGSLRPFTGLGRRHVPKRAGSVGPPCLFRRAAPPGFASSRGNFAPGTGWECLAADGSGSVQAAELMIAPQSGG
jgi:hypothetical protein